MASVSIGSAWQETSAFVRREAQLLFPISFLFIAVPFALLMQIVPPELRTGMMTQRAAETGVAQAFMLGAFLTMLIASVGALALNALALRPGISVREALQLAIRRLPVALGASLMIGFGLGVVMVLVAFISPPLAVGVAIGLGLFVAIRMVTINALVVDRGTGVIATLQQAWALTRGQFWRIAAFVIIMVVLVSLAQMVAQIVFGPLGFLIGGHETGQALSQLAVAVVSGVAQVYTMVMITRIYRQLAG